MLYALAALGALMVAVTLFPFQAWYAHRLSGPFDDPKGDVLVVLGGGVEDGVLGQSSYLRTKYAARAYKQGGFRRVVVSGGGCPIPVAEAMADLLRSSGVPADAIVVEDQATSTHENALKTKLLVAPIGGRVVLLSSDFHMYRARKAFERAGVPVLPRPIPDVMKRSQTYLGRWPAFLDEMQETAKIAYYVVRGWI